MPDCSVPSPDLVDQHLTAPHLPAACLGFDGSLARRLARAKARLDRLERDTGSRDLAALGAARIEFTQASRAVADDLIARGLDVSGD
ncbi:hypothetical protein [Halomonas ramblicola]|uniref:hypothetical protein n=1 Tax=Halomonas ramblicola TaxID=747349 RepID=UPI0025B57C1E|nr:hypothetical protein [Halomonas ramblicola]MDN3523604.1 hypothetical protein [Halomonas ramblicola]